MWPAPFIPAHTHVGNVPLDAIIICLHGNTLLLDNNQLLQAAHLDELATAEFAFLIGYLNQHAVYMFSWPADTSMPSSLQSMELRASFEVLGETLWSLAGRASQIATFYRTHRFCGLCGAATLMLETQTACECSNCKHRVWPRISPAVMVLIQRDRDVLLARSPHFRQGMYSALAGFVEAGESLEQCAHREVQEEVGVTITNLRWFGSQSWAFPHSLMLGFFAEYVSGEIVCQPDEIEDARWFSLDDLPPMPSASSLAHRLIMAAQQT